MSNRTKILRTLLVLGIVACIAGAGVFSAFSSQTDNPGNVVTAGSVILADNDAGSALYALTAAKPGDSKTSCIKVTYTGSLNASVRLYTPSTIGELGPSVTLKIEAGTQATPSFPSCTEFAPDAGGPLFEGTLSAFAAEHNGFANGVADNPGTSATKWGTNDAVVYRVTATLSAAAPDSAQSKSTGAHILRWEAQNQ
jgi:hypothetical protein